MIGLSQGENGGRFYGCVVGPSARQHIVMLNLSAVAGEIQGIVGFLVPAIAGTRNRDLL